MDRVATQNDVEKWTRHFRRMAAGKLKQQPEGYYIVDGKTTPPEPEPELNYEMISPVEQAVNLAKSELKRQRNDEPEEWQPKRRAKKFHKFIPPGIRERRH